MWLQEVYNVMKLSFKQWLSLDEIVMGSDGQRDNQLTQTQQATAHVGNKWLADKATADTQANLISGSTNRSSLADTLTSVGADAVKKAGTKGKTTSAPQVAQFVQKQLGLPNVIKPSKIK